MSNENTKMDAFEMLTAACEAYAANPTEANRIALLLADDAARAEMGLEVML